MDCVPDPCHIETTQIHKKGTKKYMYMSLTDVANYNNKQTVIALF